MIHDLTKKNHAELVENATKPVVIKVSAPWCGPCVQVQPIYHKLADELSDKYIFTQLNVDEERELAIKYGITSIPSFIFLKQGNVIEQLVGFVNREELLKALSRFEV